MGVDCWYCSRYGEGSSSVTEPPSSDDLLLPLRASPSTVARMPPAPGRGAVCSESAWYCRGEISRSFFVVLLLCTGRCYKAEICVILLFLIGTFRCNHFFAEVKIFIFRPKTMDYNKAFLPKSRRFSAVLLLHSGRCYEAEIYAILFLLRCPFIRYHFFWPKSNFSDFGQKPWTTFLPKSRRFSVVLLLHSGRCCKAEICAILFLLRSTFRCNHFPPEVKIFRIWPKTMDYNKAFLSKSRRFSVVLLLHSGRCYEAEICAILLLLRCPFR